jgi:YHS domain-containing protein
MLIRLAILAAVLYILYRLFRARRPSTPVEGRGRPAPREDVLVQDPWCKTYVPKGQAVVAVAGGKDYHFCSQECRKRFLEQQEAGQGQAPPGNGPAT